MADAPSGFDAFCAYLQAKATQTPPGWPGTVWFVLSISEECAGIFTQYIFVDPLRFLQLAAGAPPLQFGTEGFSPSVVDDRNPARHYVAFVFIGFWLPRFLALIFLYLWEIAGFVRYKGHWSSKDIVCGRIGIAHGRWVRRSGPTVLPALAAAELADRRRIHLSAAQFDKNRARGYTQP